MTDIRRVLLLHGLWMRPASLALLARRLREAGFEPEAIGYPTVRADPSRAIAAFGDAASRGPCHVVGHSLGGLVTLTALERTPELPVRRVVCLGSPLCGSAVADGVARLPLVGRTLGRSRDLLRRGCTPWRGEAEVGMVAGALGFGLGRFLARFDGPSDGTVSVAETRLEGLADHRVVRTSHTGLVLSPQVARDVATFLREGRFGPRTGQPAARAGGGGSGKIRGPSHQLDVHHGPRPFHRGPQERRRRAQGQDLHQDHP